MSRLRRVPVVSASAAVLAVVVLAAPAAATTSPGTDPGAAGTGPAASTSSGPSVVGDVDLAAAVAALRAQIDVGLETVFVDEDSLKFGACPLISTDQYAAIAAPLGVDYEVEIAPGEYETLAEQSTDAPMTSIVGIYCDFDPVPEDAVPLGNGLISVFDITNPEIAEPLEFLTGSDADPAPGPDGIGGQIYFSCEPADADDDPAEPTECLGLWMGDDIGVGVSVDVVPASVDDFEAAVPNFVVTALGNLAAT